MATWSYEHTAVIWAEKSDGAWRHVAAVDDDETGTTAAGPFPFTVPDTAPHAPGEIYDPWEPMESAAERVLKDNGWRVAESWNSNAHGSYAPAERI